MQFKLGEVQTDIINKNHAEQYQPKVFKMEFLSDARTMSV